jgi:2-hydroxy-6-oxonona-2,4-dienedioate hydrolase
MRVSFRDIGGIKTRIFHQGAGKHGVILLHGVGVGADSWFWNIAALSADDRMCVAPDLLGFGMTDEPAGSDDVPPHDQIVGHLVALIDELGLERVTLVGSSFGSQVACLLYWRIAARVDRLVLVGCSPALNGPATLGPMYEQSFANGIKAMSEPTLEVCRRRMKNLVHDEEAIPEALLLVQLTLYGLPHTRARYERRMRGIMAPAALQSYDVTTRLHKITVPTLVVWGRHDIRGNLEEAFTNAERLPAGRMLVYENCGHLPYLENPAKFNAHVLEFMASSQAVVSKAIG